MSINERIRFLRKEKLDLTQTEFAEKLGLGKTAVSKMESKTSTVTEQNIKFICKEFNVNYAWLVNGDGEIFSSSKNALIDRLADEYKLSEQKRKLVERILSLSDEEINYFTMSVFGFEFIKKD